MDYFFIYSAGGGGGEWDGLKRVWKQKIPTTLKSNLLLKFGDVFFRHASEDKLIKPILWKRINNLRQWLYEGVQDEFVKEQSKILLDSGTSKVVTQLDKELSNFSPLQIIETFEKLFVENNVLDKYIEIIQNSDVNYAVTFDIPNPFKVRAQSSKRRINIFDETQNSTMIESSANYANTLYKGLNNNQEKILTIINGFWNKQEIETFLSKLSYNPNKLAVGGLSQNMGKPKYKEIILNLLKSIDFTKFERVHLLGAGGIDKVSVMKELELNLSHFSIDNSTAWNRGAVDKYASYFPYGGRRPLKINENSVDTLLELHSHFPTPLFNVSEMANIFAKVIAHQNGSPDYSTYDARALLAVHNSDVFRVNAL